ncbi:MAG: glucoamylase family protein [Gemmataceae bacterium]
MAKELAATAADDYWPKAVAEQVQSLHAELSAVCPWLPVLREAKPAAADSPWGKLCRELATPRGVADWAKRLPALRAELAAWAKGTPAPGYEAVAERLAAALDRSTAAELVDALESLGRRAVGFADRMDFRFLYNPGRHLFTIGFEVPHHKPDAGHYDLLASESCVTSFLMVARGVVPRKHWFMLGRLVTRAAGRPGLVSWGGTMFEYLMPRLVLPPARGTLLDTAQRTAVARHVEYGRQLGLPWGVSESGFAALGPDGDYQYQSFGVPGLGLKRGLAKDRVVAPYATLLAVQTDPAAAVANFARLRADGGEGAFGFYEAIDYTPGRVRPDDRAEVVKSYMAHHQGMGLCAIANRLTGDALCRRLRAEPAVRAAELLLHERVPTEATDLRPAEVAPEPAAGGTTPDAGGTVRRLTRVDAPAPRTHFLSNGRFTTVVTHAGGGGSTCNGLAVTRWRPDPTRDSCGSAVYVRDVESGKAWSAGHLPLATPADFYEAVFCVDKAEFRRRDGLIETVMEVTVAPDADVEVRRLTLTNNDTEPRTLAVTTYAEPVLLDPRADAAHPAFGKLFLETDWLPRWDALVCRRRPRSPEQQAVFAVHVLGADPAVTVGAAEYETDRMTFLGRRRSPADPDGLGRPLTGSVGPVLDPVFAVRKTVRLEAGRSTTLTIATAVTDSREAAERVADHYHAPAASTRAFELAWAHSRVELRRLGITAADSHLFQRLAGHVLFPPHGLRAARAVTANRQGQPGLWRHGISGDLPILLVVVGDEDGMALARQVLKAQAFWRGRGFVADVVLIADKPEGYREELAEELNAVARDEGGADRVDKPGGVFVRKSAVLDPEDRTLLFAAARVVLSAVHGTLAEQVEAPAGRRGARRRSPRPASRPGCGSSRRRSPTWSSSTAPAGSPGTAGST